jgi:AhpD family alkylhydroperoxidase
MDYQNVQNHTEWFEESSRLREKLEDAFPAMRDAQTAVREEAYQDGVVSKKTKHLIALGIAMRIGCQRCLVGHTKFAIESGATKEELIETMKVGIAMGGTPAIGWSHHIVKYMEEQGML